VKAVTDFWIYSSIFSILIGFCIIFRFFIGFQFRPCGLPGEWRQATCHIFPKQATCRRNCRRVADCRLISDSGRRKVRCSDIRTCVTLRDSVTEVFQLLILKFGTVYPSALRALDLTFDRFKRGLKDLSVYIGVMRSQRLVTVVKFTTMNQSNNQLLY